MIRHITTLIWNQKRKHIGLSFEIFFSFMVLFGVFSLLYYNFQWFFQPLGFEYEQVWNVTLDTKDAEEEEVNAMREQISQLMNSYSEVESHAYSHVNIPFGFGTNTWGLELDGVDIDADVFRVSDGYVRTFDMPIIEGRNFGPEDDGTDIQPILITQITKEKFFGEEAAVGKTIYGRGNETPFRIVGVVADFRYKGTFGEVRHGFFIRTKEDRWMNQLLVKTNQGADARFESKMLKELSMLAPDWSIDIDYFSDMKDNNFLMSLLPVLIFGIISAFLIFNVSLGLFGVLWQNISKRREEIGIRRSMGATKREITTQFIGEIIVLASFSVLFGIFFAVQFPLLNIFYIAAEVYIWGILAAIVAIYLLVFLCAYFPSAQAAKLHPAVALRDE